MAEKFKRKIKLPKPALQLKMVLVFLCLGLSCVLLQFSLVSRTLGDIVNQIPEGSTVLGLGLSGILWKHLFTTLAILIPLTVSVGILVTFRVAGPIYRFETYLQAVAAGKSVGPCKIRRGDELWELCEAINQAVLALRDPDSKAMATDESNPEATEEETPVTAEV